MEYLTQIVTSNQDKINKINKLTSGFTTGFITYFINIGSSLVGIKIYTSEEYPPTKEQIKELEEVIQS